MEDAAGELSEGIRSRLESATSGGAEVVGPTPAEDTAGHAAAPGAEETAAGWTVALRFETPAGDSETVTGSGPTPDAAAEVALQRFEESAGSTSG